MNSILLTLLMAAGWQATDVATASLDRSQFPQQDWGDYYYVSVSPVEQSKQGELLTALRLILPSVSRQPVLERCLPVQVSPTLVRVGLADMQFDQRTWLDMLARNPYSYSKNPLVIRGDWLLLQLTDCQESDTYYRLVFGGKAPKTRDEALKNLGVDFDKSLRYGLIEGNSGVSVSGVRWLENRPISRGYLWGTRDSVVIDGDTDPLEHLTGGFEHNGEEYIAGVRKVHLGTGTQGVLQVYFLANGQGKIVNRAPVDLVRDATQFRGLDEIRNCGSCVQCHDQGLNLPSTNELRRLIQDGVDIYTDKQSQQDIEAFHLANITNELKRSRDDYQAIVKLATGVESVEATACLKRSIQGYDADLDIGICANELGVDLEEFRSALAFGSATGDKLGARLSDLAHGGTIPRAAWEQKYLYAQALITKWRIK